VLGQFGNNSSGVVTSSPIQIGTLSTWTQIVGGRDYTLAIQTPGTLWAWGGNTYGQLGFGDLTNRSTPTQIGILSNWRQIASGSFTSVALQTTGAVWVWGFNTNGQIGNNGYYYYPVQKNIATRTWNSVVTNRETTLFIDNFNTIWGLGNNSFGQLAITNQSYQSSPVQVGAINTANKVETKSGSTTILIS